jgi:hypothetical protein
MRGTIVHIALIGCMALVLTACGFADSRSPLPEFMRAKSSEPPPPEPQPDVRQMVHDQLDSIFVAQSNPQDVRVSSPHHDPRGPGWTACVRAEVVSATGKPLGTQTYRLTIDEGVISDRIRVGPEDNCDSEAYRPI